MSEADLPQLTRQALEACVRDLLQANADLLLINGEQQERIVRLEEEVARLKGGKPPSKPPREVPDFVKANRPKKDPAQPKKARKRRPHGFARKAEEPTQTVVHAPESCSRCGRKLEGGTLHSKHQVIDIPFVPYQVVEHQYLRCKCGVCGHRETARADLSEEVLGQCRLGVRVMSWICYLDTVARLPHESIQALLKAQHGLHVSKGQIARVLQVVAGVGQATYDTWLEELRRSPVVHADETGAREDGINGYLWSVSTDRIRIYHRDPSRGAAVIQRLLGHDPDTYKARGARGVREANAAAKKKSQEKAAAEGVPPPTRFRGKLVADFYSAYSWFMGPIQRCLTHLCRALHELKVANDGDRVVANWADKVHALTQRAKTWAAEHCDAEPDARRQQRRAFEQEAADLARPYCQSALPQKGLAERIVRFLRQLFLFVEFPDVPPDNNAAERAIRPFVVLRKVSGGTRSTAGSDAQAVLLSLFATWRLRDQDGVTACQQMLAGRPSPAPT
jgi:transposase